VLGSKAAVPPYMASATRAVGPTADCLSLIMPQSGVRHVGGALDSAFSYFAKVRVRWDMQSAPDMPRA
jgi:hypothetical protein